MNKWLFTVLIAVALLMSGCCSVARLASGTIQGSGRVADETRDLGDITSIVLQSSADVDVTFGDAGSVVVEAEDNILPLIETKVQNGQLVISTRPNARISTTRPVRVRVITQSLDMISLRGSGNIKVSDLDGDALQIDLPGSGNITVTGAVNKVEITLRGSGEIICSGLKAKAAAVQLPGSGNVTVYASESLDANIQGSGNIQYSGDPVTVHRNVTGSGNIKP